MDLAHPVVQEMVKLGCRNQFSIGVTFHVYMNLCEVQAVRDVKYFYNQELDLLYLTGRAVDKNVNDSGSSEVYLPLSSSAAITPAWIEEVQEALCPGQKKGLTLVFKDHDSTLVYYRITRGLVLPDSPETARKKKECEEKKRSTEMDLRKMKNELLEKARKAEDEQIQETKGGKDVVMQETVCKVKEATEAFNGLGEQE